MKFGPIKLPVVTAYDLDREQERLERLRKNYSSEGDSAQATRLKLQIAIVELARAGLDATIQKRRCCMSMIRCDGCDRVFDSDEDPDCFVEVGNMRAQTKDVVWCRSCRDRHEEAQDREPRRMPADWQPTAEQQAIMDAAEADAGDDVDPTP